jgi:protein-tyrosine-phosphatase
MAAAFARRERDDRGLEGVVKINSAGTNPADHVAEEAVEAMGEVDIDISDQSPTYVVLDSLKRSHFLITMGCSIAEFNPDHYGVESREWKLTDPEGKDMETVRDVRDDIEGRVESLFDEIEATANERAAEKSLSQRVRTAVRDALSF